MAYVGTPSYLGSDIDTLASILQGEAGGEGLRGLLAVADVIRNRANQNFSGYGSSPISQALARNQFQGQSRSPSAEARQVAQQLLSGEVPNVTGGALYYANPGDSTAGWARRLNENNALKIGNHYFTDNASGQPFSGSGAMNMMPGKVGGDSMVARNFDPQVAAAQPQAAPAPQSSPPNGLLAALGMNEKQAGGVGSLLSMLGQQPQAAEIAPMPAPQTQVPALMQLVQDFLASRQV